MTHNNLRSSLRNSVKAAFLLTLCASPAMAQTYGFSYRIETGGVPGPSQYSSSSVSGATELVRHADPAGGTWGTTVKNTVYADAGAHLTAKQGDMTVFTDATADPLSATSLPNSYPYGFSEVRFSDSAVIESDTLPLNTPVTLTFHSDLDVDLGTPTGSVAGSFYGEHYIGGRNSYLQQAFSTTNMSYSTFMPDIVINTRVGARISMTGRVYINLRAHYFANYASGPVWGGSISGMARLRPVLTSSNGADVRVKADSGVIYNVSSAN